MKKFLLPAFLLTAVACGQVESNNAASEVSATTENVFKTFNWDNDSGLQMKRTSSQDTIYQDAELTFYHTGETKEGKNLHNLDIKVMSHAQHYEMGSIEDEFSDLKCEKTKVRVGLKRFTKVTCVTVETTDQRDEILFGAPQVKLVMQQQKDDSIDATLTVDRVFEKQTVKMKGLKAKKPQVYFGDNDES